MERPRLYRDQVHGQVRLARSRTVAHTDSEQDLGYLVHRIRELPAFQRLRSIRQNGLTNFVFACAEHSRFVHSIGVFELARRMYDKITENSGIEPDSWTRTIVCLAGLLHDMGHGPFSHTLEESLTTREGKPFKHERLTIRFLEEYQPLTSILREFDNQAPALTAAYISDSKPDSDHWTYRIISSQLDADRIDYMLRDASMAGIQGHGFDLERLLDMLTVHETVRIAVDESALEALEAYLLMNIHLYRIMYYHKGVRGANRLLISLIRRSFDLLREQDERHLRGLPKTFKSALKAFLAEGSNIDLNLYSCLGEHQFWTAFNEWQTAADGILSDLARRMCSRKPFRATDSDKSATDLMSIIEAVQEPAAKSLKVTVKDLRRYYLLLDEPTRVGYSPHRFEVGKTKADKAIWFRPHSGNCRPIEELHDNEVIKAMLREYHFKRIVYPRECEDIVRNEIDNT